MSNNLNLDQVAENQALKEITINTATGQLDAALTENLSVSFTGGDVTLTALQYRSAAVYFLTDATVSGLDLNLPAVKRVAVFESNSTNTQNVTIKRGSSSYVLAPGAVVQIHTDASTNGLVVVGEASGGVGPETVPYDIGTFIAGLPDDAELCLRYVFVRSIEWPASLTGSQAKAGVSATATTTLTVEKNGSSVGTIVWSAAGTTGVFTGFSAVSWVAGDILTLENQATKDVTLADISITFAGDR